MNGSEERDAIEAAEADAREALAALIAAANPARLASLERVLRIINVAAGWGLMEKSDIPPEFAVDAAACRELLEVLRAAVERAREVTR